MNKTGIAVTSVGAVLLVVAAVLGIGEARYLSTARHATGEIVDMQSAAAGQSNTSEPVIRFTTAGGVQVEFQSSFSSSAYRVGQEVGVTYDPADPKGTAAIDDPFGDYLLSIVAGVFGLIVLPIGLALLGVLRLPQGARRLRLPSLSPTLISPALLVAAVLLAAGAIGAANSALGWQPTTAEGVVTGFSRDTHFNQYPQVQFTSDRGRPHSFVSNIGMNPTPYHVGQRVTVYYDSADPGRADLDRWGGSGLLAIVLGGFAAVLLTFGVITRFLFPAGRPRTDDAPSPPHRANRHRHRDSGPDA